jgi:uncharacterized membrane protein
MEIEHVIEEGVTYIIHLLEAMGILVILIGAVKAFIRYCKNAFRFSDHDLKVDLAKALAFALEFKLGSEILKTVIIRTLDEMYILASIIALRTILTFVIHWEIEYDTKHTKDLSKADARIEDNQNSKKSIE